MTYDANKVDLIIQYALLLAGREEEFADRELGPIHLIKYVYLADLAYARRHGGDTYTGTEWRFYKFGPWSQPVNERVEPALNFIHADQRVFQSDYTDRDEWVRWSKRDEYTLNRLERGLPPVITRELSRDVHRYLKHTPSLLDFVYKTEPMLSAAPNDFLNFALVASSTDYSGGEDPALSLRMGSLSGKKQKQFGAKMRELRESRMLREGSGKKLFAPPSPRYDEVYREGMAWLDNQAGSQISEKEIVVEFSDEVWNSSTRKANDVS